MREEWPDQRDLKRLDGVVPAVRIAREVSLAHPADEVAQPAPVGERSYAPPDPGRKVLHCCRPEIIQLIEKTVVETIPGIRERALEQTEIGDHAACRIRQSADEDLGPIGVAVDPAAGLGLYDPVERVRGFEPELFAEFKHHEIPIIL